MLVLTYIALNPESKITYLTLIHIKIVIMNLIMKI